jgi:hypothetical protein
MSPTWLTLFGCGLLALADAEKPTPLRYLRPSGEKYVLECEVTFTQGPEGWTQVTRTDHGPEVMTLTVRADKKGRVIRADVLWERGTDKRTALLDLEGNPVQFKRGGTTDFIKGIPADPVVTTAPDWSDVFQLTRRYDASRGGKQEFPAVWFHPREGYVSTTFSIEKAGNDKVKVKDREVNLTRYQVKLRSGDYTVWAEPNAKVVKIVPADAKAGPVVLDGYEEATRDLK